jgi:endoglucanase
VTDRPRSVRKLEALPESSAPNSKQEQARHSGGGAGTPEAYRTWIHDFAVAVGNRPAIVVIEPDALGDFNCMNADQIAERNGMLSYAVQQFKSNAPNAWAYLDGGNAGWVAADVMAQRLTGAGLKDAHGFALNVAN